jgi:hypothetical protein
VEKILIDGYNLLYKDGVLKNLAERSLAEARERLLEMLAGSRTGEVEIVVVFDGRAREESAAPSVPGLKVLFSRHPKSADELILELLQRERRRRSLTVVTSDRKDIGRIARAEGVRWISSEAFLRRVRRAGGAAPGEKPSTASAADVDYWLERFGDGSAQAGSGPQEEGRGRGTAGSIRRPIRSRTSRSR